MLSLVNHSAGKLIVEACTTMHLVRYCLLALANATDACHPPAGRLNTQQGFGGERSEGL
jgi:hypothetical protein